MKSAHPLWEAWKSLTRTARKRGGLDPRWGDFWLFLEDVGERPVENARLYRVDEKKPYAKGNVEWKRPILDVSQLQDKSAYQRAWRMKRPHLARQAGLRRNYGLTLAQYEEMHAAQKGLCAVCRKPEKNVDQRTGRPFMLSVDHVHDESQRIRGLLCSDCNTGIGLFSDDPARLRAAADYLEKHMA